MQQQRPLKAADGQDARPDAQQAPACLPGAVPGKERLPVLLRIPETTAKDRKEHQHRQRKGVEHPFGQPAVAQGQQRAKHVQIPAGHEQGAAITIFELIMYSKLQQLNNTYHYISLLQYPTP